MLVPFRKASPQGELSLPEPLAWGNDVLALHQVAAADRLPEAAQAARVLLVYVVEDALACDLLLRDLAAQQGDIHLELLLCVSGAAEAVCAALDRSGLVGHVVTGAVPQKQIEQALCRMDFVLLLRGSVRLDPAFWCRALPVARRCPQLLQVLEPLPDPALTPFALKTALQRHWPHYDHQYVSGMNLLLSVDLLQRIGGLPEAACAEAVGDMSAFGLGAGVSGDLTADLAAAWNARVLACRALRHGAYVSPLLVPQCAHRQGAPSAHSWAWMQDLCPELRTEDGVFSCPGLSVVITGQGGLSSTIDSVLAQNIADLELCVVTEQPGTQGPPNGPKITWLSSAETLDQMMAQTRGRYVLRLEAGAQLLPGALQRMLQMLRDHPRAAICVAGGVCDGTIVPAAGSHLALLQQSVVPPLYMLRRAHWARTRATDAPDLAAQEYDLCLRLLETGDQLVLADTLVCAPQQRIVADPAPLRTAALRRLGLAQSWEQGETGSIGRKSGHPVVLFWPDYSRANPYQRLLYHTAQAKREILAAPIEVALSMQEHQPQTPISFHLHWTSFLFQDVTTRVQARLKIRVFLKALARFKARGGQIIWTVHNTLSHDGPFMDLERALSEQIVALADRVHLHSAASLPEVQAEFDLPAQKVHTARHGHYLGTYPDVVSRQSARAILGIGMQEQVILFLGQVRPYKGVAQLVQSFRQLLQQNPEARLLIGGAIHDGFWDTVEPALTASERARILASERFLDDAELQLFLRAADLAVFPYRRILTSGALLLALSFDLPVVIPSVGMTRELLEGRSYGVLYDINAPEALQQALEQMLTDRHCGGDIIRNAQALSWLDLTLDVLS